jgi:hypothetical protein
MIIGIYRWDDRVTVARYMTLDGVLFARCCPRALPHFRLKLRQW